MIAVKTSSGCDTVAQSLETLQSQISSIQTDINNIRDARQLYTKRVKVSGINSVGFQSRFEYSSLGEAGSRQSVFMFCVDNTTPIYGLLILESDRTCVWTGEGNVSASMDIDGWVTVKLPITAYDYVSFISAEYIQTGVG